MPGSCKRCGAPLIEINHHGDQLIGCVGCNAWQGDKSAFVVELNVEDWEALGKMSGSTRWTLRSKKTRTTDS
jgi:hypothetical protein